VNCFGRLKDQPYLIWLARQPGFFAAVAVVKTGDPAAGRMDFGLVRAGRAIKDSGGYPPCRRRA
jgi:hypothetical protein